MSGSQMPPEMAAALAQAAALVRGLAPVGVTDEQVTAALAAVYEEEAAMGVLWEAVLDPEQRLTYPTWGMELIPRNPAEDKQRVVAPVVLKPGAGLDLVMNYAAILACGTSALARAVMRLHGYRIVFIKAKQDVTRPAIIM